MDGILNIYKEKGFTSHDVVAKLRGILHQKKIGHTGTLDKDAVGVLPICLGKATKVCQLLTDKDKIYETEMLLGTITDTQDSSGVILEQRDIKELTEEKLTEAILSFIGEYNQIPPMYSALKVQGKKLYELARAGIEIERVPRKVQIFDISDIQITLEEKSVHFLVHCSKGTYIRTLCQDIGEKLGCGACMKSLKRIKVGNFFAENALTLIQLEEKVRDGSVNEVMIPIDELFPKYPKVVILEEEKEKLLNNGNPLCLKQQGEKLRIYHADGRFAAIYKWQEEKHLYFPEKMF